jgi:hypothetical protein
MEQTAHKLFNLELELQSCNWIVEKIKTNESYAQNLYAALCNNQFIKNEVITILKEEAWSCTWRYAGGIIADIKGYGDYLDYYCTGIGNGNYDSKADELAYRTKQYVPEGEITDEIRNDLFKLGWIIKET